MAKTITLPDDLYDSLAALARPFLDKEPADVIRWLVGKGSESQEVIPKPAEPSGPVDLAGRAPRERGAVVELDGFVIRAESVPDLFLQVMEWLHTKGLWDKVTALAPYKTSAQRYLFAKKPVHPNGKDFFVELKCRDLYVEAHKNYQTSIDQLKRFLGKLGVSMSYKGT
jgi:hypothetical protein